MAKGIIGSLIFACVAGAIAIGGQDSQDVQSDAKKFMRRKLVSMSKVVEGLATEDFSKIAQGAQDMMLLSHESEWNVFQTPAYVRMSGEFRTNAERLRDAAKAKNLDGATLAYVEVTFNCVRCHKHIRRK